MSRNTITPPFYPIIYVRGYAMTQAEVEDTVATPFMGFNLGSTKVRQDWRGTIQPLVFESPLVRLMKDHGYRDVYGDGRALTDVPGKRIPARSVIIHRYYDRASKELGEGHIPSIPEAAAELEALILKVRERVCGEDSVARHVFKVYLVAHSMGGIVVRCFLQNPEIGAPETKQLVDKVFTYATPHNGIEMLGVNVPAWMKAMDMSNFNRSRLASFFGLPEDSPHVRSLNGTFDPNRFFCLIGTNAGDYHVAGDLSRRLVGSLSDGLVRIDNAYVARAPRAFVHRSHSGHFGIVNSEEGYQNLVRFLFGDVRVDGRLVIRKLPLPPDLQRAKNRGKTIRASYHINVEVAPRGAAAYLLTRRRMEDGSAVFRQYDEIFHPERLNLAKPRHPILFSTFLSIGRRTGHGKALVFSVSLRVVVPEYEVDGRLWFDRHIPGSSLYHDVLCLEALPPEPGSTSWTLRYTSDGAGWGNGAAEAESSQRDGETVFTVPLSTEKGFAADLELVAHPWGTPRS